MSTQDTNKTTGKAFNTLHIAQLNIYVPYIWVTDSSAKQVMVGKKNTWNTKLFLGCWADHQTVQPLPIWAMAACAQGQLCYGVAESLWIRLLGKDLCEESELRSSVLCLRSCSSTFRWPLPKLCCRLWPSLYVAWTVWTDLTLTLWMYAVTMALSR